MAEVEVKEISSIRGFNLPLLSEGHMDSLRTRTTSRSKDQFQLTDNKEIVTSALQLKEIKFSLQSELQSRFIPRTSERNTDGLTP